MNKYEISCYLGKVLTAQFQVDQIFYKITPDDGQAKCYSQSFPPAECQTRFIVKENHSVGLHPCVKTFNNQAFIESPELFNLHHLTESNSVILNFTQEITVHISILKVGWALIGMSVDVLGGFLPKTYNVEELPNGRQLRTYVNNSNIISEIPFSYSILINGGHVQRISTSYFSEYYKDSILHQCLARHYDASMAWIRNDNIDVVRHKEMWDFVLLGYTYVTSFIRTDGLIVAQFHHPNAEGPPGWAIELIVVE